MNIENNQTADLLKALREDRMTTKEEVLNSLERRIKRYSEASKSDNKRPAARARYLFSISFHSLQAKRYPGQTGFDSEAKRCVSMQCVDSGHSKRNYQKFIWRK